MPYTESFLAFKDIQEQLDVALNSPKGIALTFESYNAAIRFTARAHQFRKMDRKRNAMIYADPAHSMHGASVYDCLMLRHDRKGQALKVRIEKIVPEDVKVEQL